MGEQDPYQALRPLQTSLEKIQSLLLSCSGPKVLRFRADTRADTSAVPNF